MSSKNILVSKNYYPLLLTGTIDSRSFDGEGIDLEKRIKSYESSIEKYICETDFNPIVFIENSGYTFNSKKFIELAENNGKKFEFINGTICKDEVKKHGKGYGDSFFVYEGLTKSKLLSNVDFFYKITGRIFLTNSNKIIKSCFNYRNEFISYDGMGWVITYLFKANKSDYLKVMKNVFLQCDDKNRRDMEICFWLRLYQSTLDIGSFRTYPIIEGNMGVTNKPYTKNKVDNTIRNIAIKLGVFTMKSKSSKAFWRLFQIITKRKPYVDEHSFEANTNEVKS